MNDNINLISNDLQIDTNTQGHLSETARWAKFISIAGFIFSGLIIIFALYYLSLLQKASGFYRRSSSYNAGLYFAVFLYIAAAIVWCITSLFQYRFAVKVQAALLDNNQEELEAAFRNLKVYYRICGIMTIIGLIFGGLAMIGVMVNL